MFIEDVHGIYSADMNLMDSDLQLVTLCCYISQASGRKCCTEIEMTADFGCIFLHTTGVAAEEIIFPADIIWRNVIHNSYCQIPSKNICDAKKKKADLFIDNLCLAF